MPISSKPEFDRLLDVDGEDCPRRMAGDIFQEFEAAARAWFDEHSRAYSPADLIEFISVSFDCDGPGVASLAKAWLDAQGQPYDTATLLKLACVFGEGESRMLDWIDKMAADEVGARQEVERAMARRPHSLN